MSFLNIRGKTFHCNRCNRTATVEFEDGNQMTQIGDDNVMEQLELNKIYTPKDYNPEEEGYYFHEFANCRECIERGYKNRDEYLLVEPDYQLFSYIDIIESIQDEISYAICRAIPEYYKDITVERLMKINKEAFKEMTNTKVFGIKKEKRRASEDYINKSKKSIARDFTEFVGEYEEYKELVEKGRKFEKDNRNDALKLIDYSGHIYKRIDYEDLFNLNNHIFSPSTVRFGLGSLDNIEFYEDPIIIDIRKIKIFMEKENRFALDSYTVRRNINRFKDDIYRKLVNIITNMDFWI